MKKFLVTIVLLLLVRLVSAQDSKGWRGIIPLASKRSDVGRLLGTRVSRGVGSELYVVYGYKVSVRYSSETAKNDCLKKRIGKDVVLYLLLVPQKEIRLEDLALGSEFKPGKIHDDLSRRYLNMTEGVSYSIGQNGTVTSVVYFPPGTFKCFF